MPGKKKGTQPHTGKIQQPSAATPVEPLTTGVMPTSNSDALLDASADIRTIQQAEMGTATATTVPPAPSPSPPSAPGVAPELHSLPRRLMEREGVALFWDKALAFLDQFEDKHGRKDLTVSATRALVMQMGLAAWHGAAWHRTMLRLFKKADENALTYCIVKHFLGEDRANTLYLVRLSSGVDLL